ncbi:MAG: hypothetical protein PVF84_03570 [Desulfuromonadales bacterium]|jgi:hypothetical protein
MNRKRVILVALMGVLAICLVYAYLATPRLEKAPPRATSPRQPSSGQESLPDGESAPGRRIDFAYLESDGQDFAGAQRDIFRFGQRRMVQAVPRPPVVEKDVSRPVVLPESVPVAVMQKSLSQFTFLGFLEKAGAKTVFLSSGGNLFLVKQGERFGTDQEFLVVQIDDKLLKVRHVDREGLIEVRLIEKQKLNARPVVRQGRPLVRQEEDSPGDGNAWPEAKRRGLRRISNPNAAN